MTPKQIQLDLSFNENNLSQLLRTDFTYLVQNHFDLIKDYININDFIFDDSYNGLIIQKHRIQLIFDCTIKNNQLIDFKDFNNLFSYYKNNDIAGFLNSNYNISLISIFFKSDTSLLNYIKKLNQDKQENILSSIYLSNKTVCKIFQKNTHFNFLKHLFINNLYDMSFDFFVKNISILLEHFNKDDILFIFDACIFKCSEEKIKFLLDDDAFLGIITEKIDSMNFSIENNKKNVFKIKNIFKIPYIRAILNKKECNLLLSLIIFTIQTNEYDFFNELMIEPVVKTYDNAKLRKILQTILHYEKTDFLFSFFKYSPQNPLFTVDLLNKPNILNDNLIYNLIEKYDTFSGFYLIKLLENNTLKLSNKTIALIAKKINSNHNSIEPNILKKYPQLINLVQHSYFTSESIKYVFDNKLDKKYKNIHLLFDNINLMNCKDYLTICKKYNIKLIKDEIINNFDLLLASQNKKNLIKILKMFGEKEIICKYPYLFYGTYFQNILNKYIEFIPPNNLIDLIIKAGVNNDISLLKKIIKHHGRFLGSDIIIPLIRDNTIEESFFQFLLKNCMENHIGKSIYLIFLQEYYDKKQFINSKYSSFIISEIDNKLFNSYVLSGLFDYCNNSDSIALSEYLILNYPNKINYDTLLYLQKYPEYYEKFKNIILNKSLNKKIQNNEINPFNLTINKI